MKRISYVVALFLLAAAAPFAQAAEVVRTENAGLHVEGRVQALAFGQYLDDAYRSDARLYLFLKQARLNVLGNYQDYRFHLGVAFGGEDEVKAPSPGISLGLLDAYADIPLRVFGPTRLRVGQFKVPYSRERLTDSGQLKFADRSIQNLGFRIGRDVGAALHFNSGSAAAAIGLFTGGGRDVPERYLPQRLGSPLIVVRAGFNDGVDEDAFAVRALAPEADRVRTAFYLNALYTKDSLVGHSTVLNVKASEKSLLTNGNWNPYLGQAPLTQGDFWQAGAEAVVRAPVGEGQLSAELEANYGTYANKYGRVAMPGGRLEGAFAWKATEVALRYSVLFPDPKFAAGGVAITGGRPIHELTPAITHWLHQRWLKLILDVPVLVNVPVVMENNVGAYVLTEQPDQTTLLKTTPPALTAPGTVGRQTVVEGRLLIQASF